jgi:predicted small lipoprotein YifL
VHERQSSGEKTVDRRRFTLIMLGAGLASGLSACGRRGPLEPPPYTEQGREFQRRAGGNSQQQQQRPQGSVRNSLARDDDQKGTVDVESDIERGRGEGVARSPSDPTLSEPGAQTSGGSALQGGGRRRPPGIVPPKRDFILDGLLE